MCARAGVPHERRTGLFRHSDVERDCSALAANRDVRERTRQDRGHHREPREACQHLGVILCGGNREDRHVADRGRKAAQAAERCE